MYDHGELGIKNLHELYSFIKISVCVCPAYSKGLRIHDDCMPFLLWFLANGAMNLIIKTER